MKLDQAVHSAEMIHDIVRETWAGVLRRKSSSTLGFMELGGSSLMAAQVATTLNDRLGLSLTLIDVIASESLEAFCDHVEGRVAARRDSGRES